MRRMCKGKASWHTFVGIGIMALVALSLALALALAQALALALIWGFAFAWPLDLRVSDVRRIARVRLRRNGG